MRRGIASVDGANVSQVFGRPHIPPLSSIAHEPGILELRRIMGFEEGDVKNIMNPEVGWKGQPEGEGIDVLDYTEWFL